jgi:hypothetical protein
MAKDFRGAVEQYCEAYKLNIIQLDDTSAEVEFISEDGYTFTLYLEHDPEEEELLFSVPSHAVFDQEEDIPDEVSTFLLKRNVADDVTGHWALEELEEGWQYILYHDLPLPTCDYGQDIPSEEFGDNLRLLINEVEEFNELWEEEDW